LQKNPCLVSLNLLPVISDKGVTRVSFGIQTFIKSLRKELALNVGEEDIFQLVEKINKIKFKNGFGTDIMINLPNQTISNLETDIKKIFAINPTQIDFYNLALFPGSAFYERIMNSDKIKIKPSDDRFVELYTIILDRFKEKKYNGVKAYSFSLDKKATYTGGFDFLSDDYSFLGVGPSASSYFNERGYKNHTSLDKYIGLVNNSIFPVESGTIATEQIKSERLMVFSPVLLKIDKNQIPDNWFVRKRIETLLLHGYVKLGSKYLEVTDLGHIWAGNLQRYFFSNSQLEKEKAGSKQISDCTENFEIWFRQ
jgi:coproporphyrinogen III oxidase-like Fe-S oxidoreductase